MAVSEYVFGLFLGFLAIILFYLSSLEPHPPPPQKPSPPPSPPLTPRDPDLPNEPYDEEAIISSMKTIYDLLLNLQYLKLDEIIYPPPSGHAINEELCRSLNLDDRVISLMQRLPCPRDIETSTDFNFIEETRCPVYLDDEDIKESRDPENDGSPEELRLDYLLPTDIALTIGMRYGKSLVLDTKESRCCVFIVLAPLENYKALVMIVFFVMWNIGYWYYMRLC